MKLWHKGKTLVISLLCICLFFLVFVMPAAGLPLVGTLGNGPCFDVLEKNGYLYVAQGCEVRVYPVGSDQQISGLTWKSDLARIRINSVVYSLESSGNTLYIVSGSFLVNVDITNPSSPRILAKVSPTSSTGTISDIELKGSTAYLSIKGQGIQVVDVSNPSSPVMGKLVPLSGLPARMAIEGNYLYVPTETGKRLDIFDISNPADPVLAGTFAPGDVTSTGGFSSVAVKNGYAYLVEYYQGVRVVDVRTPQKPVQVKEITGVNANDVSLLSNYAYVSVRYQGFNIYDISVPASPTLVGKGTGMAGYIEGIHPSPGYTYLAGESFGFAVYKTSTPATPKLMVQVPVIGGVDSVVAGGNYLYVGAHNYGIWVIDISDKSNPREVALVRNDGRNDGIDLVGNTLVVSGEWSGLNVVDVTNPTLPVPLALDFGENIGAVLADGNYVYTSAGIVDISRPSAPVYVAKSPYFTGKMAKYGDKYLLIADPGTQPTNGIHILDVSDKKNPRFIATYKNGTGYYDVAVVGNTGVGLTGYTIETFDLSDISNPRFITKNSYSGSWLGYSLDAVGTTIYASGGPKQSIKVFDVSNPSLIKQIDSAAVVGAASYCKTIDALNGYVYTGNKWGLSIFASGNSPASPMPTTTRKTTVPTTVPTTKTATNIQVPEPDLTLSSVNAPSTTTPGDKIGISVGIKNSGTAPAPSFSIAYFLSRDTALNWGDTAIGSSDAPSLPVGASGTFAYSTTLPTDLTGTYYVITKIDSGADVRESNEDNNIGISGRIEVQGVVPPTMIPATSPTIPQQTSRPDLEVLSVTVPSAIQSGASVVVSSTIRNTGASPAPAFSVGYYLSRDMAYDPADILIGANEISTLGEGSTGKFSCSVSVPGDAAGIYTIIARADRTEAVSESNEGNNLGYSGEVTVQASQPTTIATPTSRNPKPDLTITQVTAQSGVTSGTGIIQISSTVKNVGDLTASYSYLACYLSRDPVLDSYDALIGNAYVSYLPVGYSHTARNSFKIPPGYSGTCFVIVLADGSNLISEKNESNNSGTSGPVGF